MTLLEMSFTGAVLVGITALLRAFALHRLPKGVFLALWWMALARFLLPVSLSSPVSVYSLLESASAVVSEPQAAVFDAPVLLPQAEGEPSAFAQADMAGLVHTQALPLLPLLWAAGTAGCALYFAVVYRRCGREFRTSLPARQEAAEVWLAAHPLRRRVEVRVSERTQAPLTYGILRPVILLPEGFDFTDAEALDYVFTHEWTHIRRFDGLTKLLAATAVSLHWWNPAAWVLYVLYSRDLELSCDAAVVRRCGGRAGYARALIQLEERKSGLVPLCGFGRNAMEERITAIMKMKKITAMTVTASAAVVVLVGALFATSAEAAAPAVTHQGGGESSIPADWLPASTVDQNKDGELLSELEKYGITCDSAGKLYFNGERVRWFWDGWEICDYGEVIGWSMHFEYLDRSGTVDVHTVRETIDNGDGSVDPYGPLTGVTAYSQAEFDARDLDSLTRSQDEAAAAVTDGVVGITQQRDLSQYTERTILAADESQDEAAAAVSDGVVGITQQRDLSQYTEQTDTALTADKPFAVEEFMPSRGADGEYKYADESTAVASGGAAGGKTFAEIFAEYKKYGVTYREVDGVRELFYNGEPVAHFADQKPDGGVFSFSPNGKTAATLALRTVYDEKGRLTGVAPDGQASAYEPYRAFGVYAGKDGKLRLGGTLIRCLDDDKRVVNYCNPEGEIDVYAERVNGELTGLKTASQKDFDSRILRDASEPVSGAKENEAQEIFDEYAAFGLTRKNGALYYKGEGESETVRVRLFLDEQKGLFSSRTVSSWDAEGEQDVYAVRNWRGRLTGLRIPPWRESVKNTMLYAELSEDEREQLEWSYGEIRETRKEYPVRLSAQGGGTVVCEGKSARTLSVRLGMSRGPEAVRVAVYRKNGREYETIPAAEKVLRLGDSADELSLKLYGGVYKIVASLPDGESGGQVTLYAATA